MRVRISWSLPVEGKTAEEVGKIMVFLLPLSKSVEADSEGAVIDLIEDLVDKEELKELKRKLKYIGLEIEEE